MWQHYIGHGKKTWEEAKSLCENLKYAGYTDWRVPTIKELRTLTKKKKYRIINN